MYIGVRGLVRDCHGDLRAEHVVIADGVEVFDCVEFDPALRAIDVGADLAFLLMDLERLGAPEAARTVLAAYRAAGGDPGDERLLAFHAALRELEPLDEVGAHVTVRTDRPPAAVAAEALLDARL